MNGYFISIEGTDGSGKTTQIEKLYEYLQQKGYEVVLTREPGGTQISEQIREILLNPQNTQLCDTTELLLYAASRAQHLQEKILPAVQSGKIVICDRFADSTVAYQGFGRGLDIDLIQKINNMATGEVQPDVTLYLDMPPKQGLLRKQQDCTHELDRLEQEKLEFHQRVYQGYEMLWKRFPNRIFRVDATNSIEEVFQQIQGKIEQVLQKK